MEDELGKLVEQEGKGCGLLCAQKNNVTWIGLTVGMK